MKDPCDHWATFQTMYTDGPPPNLDRCPWCGAIWPEPGTVEPRNADPTSGDARLTDFRPFTR